MYVSVCLARARVRARTVPAGPVRALHAGALRGAGRVCGDAESGRDYYNLVF